MTADNRLYFVALAAAVYIYSVRQGYISSVIPDMPMFNSDGSPGLGFAAVAASV